MPAAGERVVVRHLLPSGQASDVIGTLISDGEPLVVERDGVQHTIARSAVLAYKSVPPRPVRASEIRSLDLARARSWWSVEQAWIDGWLCRAAPGLAGGPADCAASCAAPLHPDATLDHLGGVRDWFTARGLPLRLTLSERALRGADRRTPVIEPADVLIAPAAGDDHGASVQAGVEISETPGPGWLALTAVALPLATSVDGTALFVSIPGPDGATVAAGRLSLTADAAGTLWGGIGSMAVAPGHRRRGHAPDPVRAVVSALRERAAGAGAQRVFVEVTQADTGAQALYRELGFTRHHAYHYWSEDDPR